MNEAILLQWLPQIQRMARHWARSDADDLAQDVMIKLLELRPERLTSGYCYSVVRYVGLRRWERTTREARAVQLMSDRARAGLQGGEVWGRIYPNIEVALAAQASLRKMRQIKFETHLTQKLEIHTRHCKNCGRGVPDPLDYCSGRCERAKCVAERRRVNKPTIKTVRRGGVSRFVRERALDDTILPI